MMSKIYFEKWAKIVNQRPQRDSVWQYNWLLTRSQLLIVLLMTPRTSRTQQYNKVPLAQCSQQ
jgi:hypothetical protein